MVCGLYKELRQVCQTTFGVSVTTFQTKARVKTSQLCPLAPTPVCGLTCTTAQLNSGFAVPLDLCRTCSVSDLRACSPPPAAVSVASGIKGLIHQVEQLFPDSPEDSRGTRSSAKANNEPLTCEQLRHRDLRSTLIEPLDIAISAASLFM